MSERTHQYRQLGRRDPATTAELFTRDGAGNPIPMATSPDGKLVVEVSGGTGGGVIQGRDELGVAHDVLVDDQGRLVIEGEITVDDVGIQALNSLDVMIPLKATDDGKLKVETGITELLSLGYDAGAGANVPLSATPSGRLEVQVQDDATVSLRALGDAGLVDLQASADGLYVDFRPTVLLPVEAPMGLLVNGNFAGTQIPIAVDGNGIVEVSVITANPVDVVLDPAAEVTLRGMDGGTPVALAATPSGALLVDIGAPTVSIGGVVDVRATHLSAWALASALGPVVIAGYTDANGWMDIRAYSRLSITAAGTGSFTDPLGVVTALGFDGSVKVEYKVHDLEVEATELVPPVVVNGARHAIISPTSPQDVLGIGYMRLVIETNTGLGDGAFFAVAK